jgi:hypothetical protein
MFASQFVRITQGYTDRQRQAAEMLIAGVAFQKDGKTWTVISHEGDFMGEMSTFIVSQTAHMLKKAGLKNNNSRHYQGPNAHPTNPGYGVCTFGHNGFTAAELNPIMERRFKRPLTLL